MTYWRRWRSGHPHLIEMSEKGKLSSPSGQWKHLTHSKVFPLHGTPCWALTLHPIPLQTTPEINTAKGRGGRPCSEATRSQNPRLGNQVIPRDLLLHSTAPGLWVCRWPRSDFYLSVGRLNTSGLTAELSLQLYCLWYAMPLRPGGGNACHQKGYM